MEQQTLFPPKVRYDTSTFTWGCELEWGDIDRRIDIPSHLGSWNLTETCIVNTRPPYYGIAADPLGIDPPFGGEINTYPTTTWEQQVENIMELRRIFEDHGTPPTPTLPGSVHVHVHVPGLTEDIQGLKDLVTYIRFNQYDVIEHVYGFKHDPGMDKCKGSARYLKHGAVPMSNFVGNNILRYGKDLDSFFHAYRICGTENLRNQIPRQTINLFTLKHINTIEFRCFFASIDMNEFKSAFKFALLFLDAALNQGPSVKEILSKHNFVFPRLKWDADLYTKWENTKKSHGQLKKVRTFIKV